MSGKIIWTRARADWDHDVAFFGDDLPRVFHLPCIETTPLKLRTNRLKPDALIFTSGNAVKFSAANPQLLKTIKSVELVFTHGAKTAEALRMLGVRTIQIDAATSADMGQELANRLSPAAKVLWLSASDVAHDLVKDLAGRGISVTRSIVYETARALRFGDGSKPTAKQREELIRTLKGVVCFASPSAVKGFAETLQPDDNRLGQDLCAIAIGSTTQAACNEWFQFVITCGESTVEALAREARGQLEARFS